MKTKLSKDHKHGATYSDIKAMFFNSTNPHLFLGSKNLPYSLFFYLNNSSLPNSLVHSSCEQHQFVRYHVFWKHLSMFLTWRNIEWSHQISCFLCLHGQTFSRTNLWIVVTWNINMQFLLYVYKLLVVSNCTAKTSLGWLNLILQGSKI